MKNLFARLGKAVAAAAQRSRPAAPTQSQEYDQLYLGLLEDGNHRLAARELDHAVASYARAVELRPEMPEAHLRLGFALSELRSWPEAHHALSSALKLQPALPDAHYLLGTIAAEQGLYREAAQAFKQALGLSPMLLPAYGGLAAALFRSERKTEAFAAVTRGLGLFPNDAGLYFFRGNLLAEVGKFHEAAQAYRQAIDIKPDFAEALANLGNCERHLGETQSALQHLRKALDLQPHHPAWHSNLLFTLQYTGELSPQALFEAHLDFARIFEKPLLHEHPAPVRLKREAGSRLRIGYVSGDLRAHSLAYFIEPVLRHHDPDRIEVFCYYTYTNRDDVSLRLQALAAQWRNCVSMSDEEMTALVRQDGIHVLVDLSGHTGYNRLGVFARKAAPVQITWLGYQATTGLSSMDWRITDAAMDPVGKTERYHTEQLLRLSCAAVFQPDRNSPEIEELPSLDRPHITFGCLNNPAKITAEFAQAVARILLENPGTRLVLGNSSGTAKERLLAKFVSQGAPQDRIEVLNPLAMHDYLAAHQQIDICLDTFPYNGGTTTLHSLWMGVPVLSLEGELPISRVGTELMRGLGFPEFACPDLESYIRRAGELIQDKRHLQEVRRSLRPQLEGALIDQARAFTRELEAKFEWAWDQACAASIPEESV